MVRLLAVDEKRDGDFRIDALASLPDKVGIHCEGEPVCARTSVRTEIAAASVCIGRAFPENDPSLVEI